MLTAVVKLFGVAIAAVAPEGELLTVQALVATGVASVSVAEPEREAVAVGNVMVLFVPASTVGGLSTVPVLASPITYTSSPFI